jgi:hypothetical protein
MSSTNPSRPSECNRSNSIVDPSGEQNAEELGARIVMPAVKTFLGFYVNGSTGPSTTSRL